MRELHAAAMAMLVCAAVLPVQPAAHAQCDGEIAKLLANDGATNDELGVSVAVSGDLVVVGAWLDDDHGTDSGAAYLFERIDDTWMQTAKLTASDGEENDRFGVSVALSGDVIVVGARWDDDLGNNSGSAYVFENIDGVWMETSKLTAADGAADDNFGWSVAASGNAVIVGAYADDDHGLTSGSAYIFERVDGAWSQMAKLTASDGAANDSFGWSVAVSGDVAIAGAPWDDDLGTNSGSAYVFQRIEGVWMQMDRLTASDGAMGDWLGTGCFLDGSTVIVGSRFDDDHGTNSGSAYIFENGSGEWMQTAKLTASDATENDWFGYSVSLSANNAVVGAPYGSAAYVFERMEGVWTESVKLTASDGAMGDYLGGSVAVDGDIAVAGARWDADLGEESGSAYVFELEGIGCPADLTEDCTIDAADLGFLLGVWGTPDADLNGDGTTDAADLAILLGSWGPCQ